MTLRFWDSCRDVLASVAVATLVASPLHAQLGIDRSEIRIRPSVTAERVGVINVTNTSDRPVQAVVKLEDWNRSEEGSNRWFPQGTVDGSCGKLLAIFPLSLSLDAGASQSIRLSASDSTAGLKRECWSAVILETVQPPAQRGGVRYIVRSAVKVYVEPSDLQAAGEVTDMRVLKRADAPDSLEVWFRNTGGLHYIGKGTVEFRRADNSVAAKVDLEDYYILPGARQRGVIAIPKLATGEYIVIGMVDFGGGDIAAMQIDYVVAAANTLGAGR